MTMIRIILRCIFGGFLSTISIYRMYTILFVEKDIIISARIAAVLVLLFFIISGIKIIVKNIQSYCSGDYKIQQMEKRAQREEKLRMQNERKRAMAATSNKAPKSPKKSKTGSRVLFVGGILTYLFFGIIGGLTSKYTKKRR